MKLMEKYYTPKDVATLLCYDPKWVIQRIRAGDFGRCVMAGRDYRIPASGINAWLERHEVRIPEPVAARTEGELRRKVRAKEECPDV